MKVGVIGCVEFSEAMLRTLFDVPDVEIVGVVTKARSAFNSDFRDLGPLARSHGAPVFHQGVGDQQDMIDWFRERKPDVIFCVGWPNLLDEGLLAIPRHGVVGYHPTDLPRNRGRHPIIWALALGLEETASTFFRIDGGVDSGPILSKVKVPIGPDDDAGLLYARLIEVARAQLPEIVRRLAAGRQALTEQDLGQGNVWRKRSKVDGRIDWRMSAAAIHNLVRALNRPYPGAWCETGSGDARREINVWKVRPAPCDQINLEPGRVLKVAGGVILVKAGDGAVEIIEHDFDVLPAEGDYL